MSPSQLPSAWGPALADDGAVVHSDGLAGASLGSWGRYRSAQGQIIGDLGHGFLCIYQLFQWGNGTGELELLFAAQRQLSSQGGFKTGCGYE